MRILMLLILLSNVIALILALIYYHLNNKVIKDYKRELALMNYRVEYYKGLSKFIIVRGQDHE